MFLENVSKIYNENKKNIKKYKIVIFLASLGILIIAVTSHYLLDKTPNDKIMISDIAAEKELEVASEPVDKYVIVEIAGAVKNPSIVELIEGSRVYEAIEASGGLLKIANTDSINQAALLQDGEKIYIPTEDEVKLSLNDKEVSRPLLNQGSQPQTAKVNINTADSTTLQTLNGVGPVTAEKIIEYRNSNGSFQSVTDLKKVSGIGDKTFEKLKDFITV